MEVNFVLMIKWNLIWFDIVIFGGKTYIIFKAETCLIFVIYADLMLHK